MGDAPPPRGVSWEGGLAGHVHTIRVLAICEGWSRWTSPAGSVSVDTILRERERVGMLLLPTTWGFVLSSRTWDY